MTEEKNKGGRKKEYKDEDFLNVISSTPQTTSQVLKLIKEKHCKIIHDTVLKNLLRLSDDGFVEKIEFPAASRTGKMYLWKITEEGEIKRKEEEN